MQPYQERFTTRYYEMGPDHKMRVQRLLNYMEEAAGKHAGALGVGLSRLAENGLSWVLTKMRLIINRRPAAGEDIIVETWPVKIEKLQFRRDFIFYGQDGEVLATAVTQWVVINLASRKLERFPPYIAAMEPENPPLAQESGDIRVSAVPPLEEGGKAGPSFPVRLADIDQNRHVNNGRYVDFAFEVADLAGFTSELRQMEILFRAEGLRGDVITSRSFAEEGPERACVISLCRQSDGQELARVRTAHAPSGGR